MILGLPSRREAWLRGFEEGHRLAWETMLLRIQGVARLATNLGRVDAQETMKTSYFEKEARLIQQVSQHVTHAELARLRAKLHEKSLEYQRIKEDPRAVRAQAQLEVVDYLLQEKRDAP